jgi:hypothetical protein
MAVQYAFGKIITQGLDLNVDAADPTSYPGTGTSWTSVVNRSITGSLVSCSFSSDFKGGIVFNNPSASVEFPGTVANYGTGSFTIEMAFRPSHIEGIHYLVSKNSGSFPNWGVYLSGSGGSGKLFAEYRINASVSCSVSSSTMFVTGSNYFVDVQLQPGLSGSLIFNNGGIEAGATSNGGGSLTTTGSFLLGNIAPSSSQAYSGSLFFVRAYRTETLSVPYYNYNPSKTRLQVNFKPPILARVLVVAGGGSGASNFGGGGGGAGGFIETTIPLSITTYNVQVGGGGVAPSNSPAGQSGTNGSSSFFSAAPSILTAIGGGRGGNENGGAGAGTIAGSGGSGGGAGSRYNSSTVGQGTFGQGFNGGTGAFQGGGGGGGAAGSGSNAPSTSNGGNGGAGIASTISGVLTYYAGGGGGGANFTPGTGGIGGGGNGANSTGQPGSVNTGGGGGGSNGNRGGNGGSGIVIIRYSGPPIATGGTITSVGGDTIHTFTTTGSSTFTVF